MTDEELRALFDDDARVAALDARVPAPGQVWWRAAMRSRAEAARAAARPLTWSQGLAVACAAGLATAVAGTAWPLLAQVSAVVAASTRWMWPVAIVAGTCLALLPLVLYAAFSDD